MSVLLRDRPPPRGHGESMRASARAGHPGGGRSPGRPVSGLRQVGARNLRSAARSSLRCKRRAARGPGRGRPRRHCPPARARARVSDGAFGLLEAGRGLARPSRSRQRARAAARSPVKPRWRRRAPRVAPTTRSSASTASSAPAPPVEPRHQHDPRARERRRGTGRPRSCGAASATVLRSGRLNASGQVRPRPWRRRSPPHSSPVRAVDRGRRCSSARCCGPGNAGRGGWSRRAPRPDRCRCRWCPACASDQAVPVHSPVAAKSRSSPGFPRRSTAMPCASASTMQAPRPPTIWNNRSRCGAAVGRSGPSRSRACASSCSAIRASFRRSAGSRR